MITASRVHCGHYSLPNFSRVPLALKIASNLPLGVKLIPLQPLDGAIPGAFGAGVVELVFGGDTRRCCCGDAIGLGGKLSRRESNLSGRSEYVGARGVRFEGGGADVGRAEVGMYRGTKFEGGGGADLGSNTRGPPSWSYPSSIAFVSHARAALSAVS